MNREEKGEDGRRLRPFIEQISEYEMCNSLVFIGKTRRKSIILERTLITM